MKRLFFHNKIGEFNIVLQGKCVTLIRNGVVTDLGRNPGVYLSANLRQKVYYFLIQTANFGCSFWVAKTDDYKAFEKLFILHSVFQSEASFSILCIFFFLNYYISIVMILCYWADQCFFGVLIFSVQSQHGKFFLPKQGREFSHNLQLNALTVLLHCAFSLFC